MVKMLAAFFKVLMCGAATAAAARLPAPHLEIRDGVGALPLEVPSNRHDDQFYTVPVTCDGQTLPVLLDTGSADLLVASDLCNTADNNSGCYGQTAQFQITNSTQIVPNVNFSTIVGPGPVVGNQSIMDVSFGAVDAPNLALGLIFGAAEMEFQNGSFSGILGMGLRNVSREWVEFGQLPPMDTLITSGKLKKPLFSLRMPRYADPDSPKTGQLTIGEIEPEYADLNITYTPVLDSPNYNYPGAPLAPQTWAIALEGVRMNGHEIPVPVSSVVTNGTFMTLFDSGAQTAGFDDLLFDSIAQQFNGPTIYYEDFAVHFDCSIPQLLEVKIAGKWLPMDPLDMIIPGNYQIINGTKMCNAALQASGGSFSDSILGTAFMRNILSVFTYVSDDMYSVQPQVGVGSLTDAHRALERYASLYEARLG